MKNILKTTLKVLLPILVITVAFGAGYKTNAYYANKQKQQSISFASNFVNDILAGKSADAYTKLSPQLAAKQNKADFVSSLSETKSAKPLLDTAIVMESNNVTVYTQRATGLDADKNGNKEATFTVYVGKEKGSLKVRSLNVQ